MARVEGVGSEFSFGFRRVYRVSGCKGSRSLTLNPSLNPKPLSPNPHKPEIPHIL